MPDSIYVQALDIITTQLPTIGAGLTGLFSDPVEPRKMDWEDVVQRGGLTVRYDYDDIRENQEGTSHRDIWGYPCYVIHAQGDALQLSPDQRVILSYFQAVVRYYHNRRRMSAVVDSLVNEEPCVVTRVRVPKRYEDKIIRAIIVWAWFIEPRTE